MTGRGDLPLAKAIEIATAHGVPVIVDGAAQLPPAENLWKFTQMGATAAIFSGGKDLRGPQTTGLVVGRKHLIENMRLNGSPNHSFGRPMKVGKEEMAGVLAALDRYLKIDHEARLARDEQIVAMWNRAFNSVRGACAERSWPNEAGQPLPRTLLEIEPDVAGLSRDALVDKLWNGAPAIAVATTGDHGIYFNPMSLTDDEAKIVSDRVVELLRSN